MLTARRHDERALALALRADVEVADETRDGVRACDVVLSRNLADERGAGTLLDHDVVARGA